MRSRVTDSMSPRVHRLLAKLGRDLSVARRKRHLTVAMMVERTEMSKATYRRVEQGDPSVSLGAYVQCLNVLGLADGVGQLADPGQDEVGLLLDQERLPQRVRPPKDPGGEL